MNSYNDSNIKLDAYGEVDYRYYINRAHQMRADAAAELMSKAASKIKQLFRQALGMRLPHRHPDHHVAA